ncbi:MAG: pyridoxamine 5'-phosphate oxidase family protein [bacterium]|nr:pyridoxamine 5'-phosphate oxidase family protein [bacterium]
MTVTVMERVTVFDDAAREFLKKPLIARISTLTTDGYPHTVPVWFMLEGDEIVFIAERSTRKIKNVLANPKGSMSVGGDVGDPAAYLIIGEMRVEEDPGFAWMKRMTRFYEAPEQAEKDIEAWSKTDMVIIRLKPTRVIKAA